MSSSGLFLCGHPSNGRGSLVRCLPTANGSLPKGRCSWPSIASASPGTGSAAVRARLRASAGGPEPNSPSIVTQRVAKCRSSLCCNRRRRPVCRAGAGRLMVAREHVPPGGALGSLPRAALHHRAVPCVIAGSKSPTSSVRRRSSSRGRSWAVARSIRGTSVGVQPLGAALRSSAGLPTSLPSSVPDGPHLPR